MHCIRWRNVGTNTCFGGRTTRKQDWSRSYSNSCPAIACWRKFLALWTPDWSWIMTPQFNLTGCNQSRLPLNLKALRHCAASSNGLSKPPKLRPSALGIHNDVDAWSSGLVGTIFADLVMAAVNVYQLHCILHLILLCLHVNNERVTIILRPDKNMITGATLHLAFAVWWVDQGGSWVERSYLGGPSQWLFFGVFCLKLAHHRTSASKIA